MSNLIITPTLLLTPLFPDPTTTTSVTGQSLLRMSLSLTHLSPRRVPNLTISPSPSLNLLRTGPISETPSPHRSAMMDRSHQRTVPSLTMHPNLRKSTLNPTIHTSPSLTRRAPLLKILGLHMGTTTSAMVRNLLRTSRSMTMVRSPSRSPSPSLTATSRTRTASRRISLGRTRVV